MRQIIKFTFLIGLIAALLATGSLPATADTTIGVAGQVRTRTEANKKSYIPGAEFSETTYLRTRLALKAVVEERTQFVIQLQDSRVFGGLDADGNPSSGTLNDGHNVDMHQAYLKLDGLMDGRLGFQAGRFEVALGGQRVFGSVGWSNVGRSWEGMDAWYQNDKVRATVYWLKKLESAKIANNSDFDIYGLNVILKDTGAEVFGFYERDGNTNLVDNVTSTVDALNRGSVGAYFKKAFGDADVESNLVYQFGDMAKVDTTAISSLDIAAYLFTAEVGYTVSSEHKLRLAAGIDYASGDDDPADTKTKTYNNLYYTGHKYRGYMDYFIGSNTAGLIDIMGRGSMKIADGWKVKADVHYFKTARDYTDFNDESTSDVGTEIDLVVTTTRLASVKVDGGFSIFLPTESFAEQSDTEAGLKGYVMVTGNFKGK